MIINGYDYKMLLTVRARREIRALCPENKLENISKLLSEEDDAEVTAKIITILSRGYEDYTQYWEGQKGQTYEPNPISDDLLDNLSMEEFTQLSNEAYVAFSRGLGISVETEPVKEKGKKKGSEKNPSN